MTDKILYVDDDPKILAAYQRNFRDRYQFDTAPNGIEALSAIKEKGPYAVVVADMKMPEMSGLDLLITLHKEHSDTSRIMLTGNTDQSTAINAVNRGHVYQFLTKPCPNEMLAMALDSGIKQYRLISAERELLEKTLKGSVKVLTDILCMLQPPSFGHSQKLRDYVRTFARELGLQDTWKLEVASMLSSIGYMAIPPDVIERYVDGEPLAPSEKDMIRRMPELGANLLQNIPRLDEIAHIILYQNKLFDGTGFPEDGVSGKDIPLGARIIKLLQDIIQVETMESMDMTRPKALDYIKAREGWYDPALLERTNSWLERYLKEAPRAEVIIENLKPGYVLLDDLQTLEGLKLVGAGHTLTPVVLQRVRNFAQLNQIREPIIIEETSIEEEYDQAL
ncbi:MAG: HD domain-containing phosphohydrolase [Verrucomicrobiota bacterium]